MRAACLSVELGVRKPAPPAPGVRGSRRPLRGAALAALVVVGFVVVSAPHALASPPQSASTTLARVQPRVDLNHATVEELTTLKGIGRKKAQAIVAFRARRPFTRLTQLLKVKGIGKKTLSRLRPHLAITSPSSTPSSTKASSPKASSSKASSSKARRATRSSTMTANKASKAPKPSARPWKGMVPGCS